MNGTHSLLFERLGACVVAATLLVSMLFAAACTPEPTEPVVVTRVVEVEKECACADNSDFPVGRFAREDNAFDVFEFDEAGNYRATEGATAITGTYCVNGDLFTEMTFDGDGSVPIIPATYSWTFDGQRLTFHLVGKDPYAVRQGWYDGVTFIESE